ncbi:MAG: OB-fold nucleic acid binding domain-containing protein, partial [Vicinamibacteria bacterium]
EADILRKAMGKKKAEVMATQMEKFLSGCAAKGVPEGRARKIWQAMEQFAGYGFNKSHSAAYAWLAYQTAFLKANYPAHFMAALLTSERGNTDKMVQYIGECREMGIRVLPPDVNEAQKFFAVVSRSPGEAGSPPESESPAADIRFGLAALKNVGEGGVEAMLAAREEGGPFRSLFDFCDRVDLKAVNRRVVESLIKSGSFDSIDERRSALFKAIDRAMDAGQRRQRDREQGQGSLLGMLEDPDAEGAVPERVPDAPSWPEAERLAFEKESLGFFITGHPLERFRAELEQWASASTGSLDKADANGEVSVGGIITGLRLIKTRKGNRMASFVLEDLEGSVECLVFPETYKKTAGLLADDQVVLVKGRAEAPDEGRARLLASSVMPLEQAKLAEARFVTIRVPALSWNRSKGERLRDILGAHRGDCPVTLEIVRPGAYAVALAPSAAYRVQPGTVLCNEVDELLGPGALVLSRSSGRRREL